MGWLVPSILHHLCKTGIQKTQVICPWSFNTVSNDAIVILRSLWFSSPGFGGFGDCPLLLLPAKGLDRPSWFVLQIPKTDQPWDKRRSLSCLESHDHAASVLWHLSSVRHCKELSVSTQCCPSRHYTILYFLLVLTKSLPWGFLSFCLFLTIGYVCHLFIICLTSFSNYSLFINYHGWSFLIETGRQRIYLTREGTYMQRKPVEISGTGRSPRCQQGELTTSRVHPHVTLATLGGNGS